jgi:GNAT superfamily N-acetyltransferase
MSLAISPATSSHETFIISNWINTYRASDQSGLYAMDDKESRERTWNHWWWTFEVILRRPTTRALIAHGKGEPDAYRGFIVFDRSERIPLVYYVLVKELYRRAGHARALFAAAGIDPRRQFFYGCRTPVVLQIAARRKIPAAKLDANWARYGKPLLSKERANG